MNTQKVINNILGKNQKVRKLRQNKIDLNSINTIDELRSFLIKQDKGHPQYISDDVIMIFGNGKIVGTKSGDLFGQRSFITLYEPITEKQFIGLKHGELTETYVTLSDNYDVFEIFKLIKRIYGQALISGDVRKYQ